MNKKGQYEFLQIDMLFKIILTIFIGSIFVMFALGSGPNKTNMIYLKSDMEMLVNSIYSSPSKVFVTYTYPETYNIKVDTEKVDISKDIGITTLTKKQSIITFKKDSALGEIKATKNE